MASSLACLLYTSSTQHSPDVTLEQIRKDMIELVIKPTVPAGLLDGETKI